MKNQFQSDTCKTSIPNDEAKVPRAYTNASGLGSGLKHDNGKPRLDLIDSGFMDEVGAVLGFGANKYAAHNWRQGMGYSALIGAAMRHLAAINRGEDFDPESGFHHTGHLGCCVMFLDWMIKNRPDLDDRYKSQPCPIS